MIPRRKNRAFSFFDARRVHGVFLNLRLQRGAGMGCALILLLCLSSSGCAFEYFDARNGIEHVWGFGHIAMKVGKPNEGLKAVGHRTDSAGLSIGKTQEGYHLGLGWSSYQEIDVVDQNTRL